MYALKIFLAQSFRPSVIGFVLFLFLGLLLQALFLVCLGFFGGFFLVQFFLFLFGFVFCSLFFEGFLFGGLVLFSLFFSLFFLLFKGFALALGCFFLFLFF